MPTYIVLSKWTDQGRMNLDNIANRERSAKKSANEMTGKQDVYFTMGEYDAVQIVEAPDDEAMAAWVLEIASHGNIQTSTMRAFTQDEFLEVIGNRARWTIE